MPTHAEISSKLLADAAGFFRNLGEQNQAIQNQMRENADVFEQMAGLLNQAPEGQIDDKSHGELAGQLMKDAATFFRALADQNEPIKEQMLQNAEVYEKMADVTASDPTGEMQG